MEIKFRNNNNQTNHQITPIANNIQNTNQDIITIQNNQLTIPNNIQNSVSIISNEIEEKEEFWVPLPYIGNVSNKVCGYLRNKLKWKVIFTPGVKIQNLLNSIKDKKEWNIQNTMHFM